MGIMLRYLFLYRLILFENYRNVQHEIDMYEKFYGMYDEWNVQCGFLSKDNLVAHKVPFKSFFIILLKVRKNTRS